MKIGTVKEIKKHEYRVGMTPSCVKAYVTHGHQVLVEHNCGKETGFDDEQYIAAGAQIVADRRKIYDDCDMIIKVKEPQREEYDLFHADQILYTYLHLAADGALTDALMRNGVKAVAYETIEEGRRLPCLKPMSEIAGRLSIQEGAKYLEKPSGGRGMLLGGVPGVRPAKVAIIGGGVVGANACRMALGMGADVTVIDVNADRLAQLEDIFDMRPNLLYNTHHNLEAAIRESDLIIGAVLLPGAKAPNVIHRDDLKNMKTGSVIVDVAVDQGGCVETTRPTTHDDPVYQIDGVIHYCVANMPGAVPLTSTEALTGATLPYGLMIAGHGLEAACRQSAALAKGLNIYRGKCTNAGVASAFGKKFTPVSDLIH